jgi:hypothetical protein
MEEGEHTVGATAGEGITLRQYLLGLLPTERHQPLEERILTDGEFYENLTIAENELIDQYLSSELTDAERLCFETHFLLAPERQRKLRFARSLRRYIVAESARTPELYEEEAAEPAEKEPDAIRPASSRWDYFKLMLARRPVMAFSMAAVMLLFVAAIAIVVVNRRPEARHEPGNVFAVTLTPGLVREGGQVTRVSIPNGTDTVRLQLSVPNAEYQSYSVSLATSERADVWRADGLKTATGAGENLLPVDIPAGVLGRDDYILRVRGKRTDGASEDVSRYTFRVAR